MLCWSTVDRKIEKLPEGKLKIKIKNEIPGENLKQKSKEVRDLMQFIYEYGLKANCSKSDRTACTK